MQYRKYNEKADDADVRPTSPWSSGRLNTNEALVSKRLKRAHDAYDEKQEQKKLAEELNTDAWEIDDD